jgi:hypothetical protein
MFWILNSENLASKPSFWMMRAYLVRTEGFGWVSQTAYQ